MSKTKKVTTLRPVNREDAMNILKSRIFPIVPRELQVNEDKSIRERAGQMINHSRAPVDLAFLAGAIGVAIITYSLAFPGSGQSLLGNIEQTIGAVVTQLDKGIAVKDLVEAVSRKNGTMRTRARGLSALASLTLGESLYERVVEFVTSYFTRDCCIELRADTRRVSAESLNTEPSTTSTFGSITTWIFGNKNPSFSDLLDLTSTRNGHRIKALNIMLEDRGMELRIASKNRVTACGALNTLSQLLRPAEHTEAFVIHAVKVIKTLIFRRENENDSKKTVGGDSSDRFLHYLLGSIYPYEADYEEESTEAVSEAQPSPAVGEKQSTTKGSEEQSTIKGSEEQSTIKSSEEQFITKGSEEKSTIKGSEEQKLLIDSERSDSTYLPDCDVYILHYYERFAQSDVLGKDAATDEPSVSKWTRRRHMAANVLAGAALLAGAVYLAKRHYAKKQLNKDNNGGHKLPPSRDMRAATLFVIAFANKRATLRAIKLLLLSTYALVILIACCAVEKSMHLQSPIVRFIAKNVLPCRAYDDSEDEDTAATKGSASQTRKGGLGMRSLFNDLIKSGETALSANERNTVSAKQLFSEYALAINREVLLRLKLAILEESDDIRHNGLFAMQNDDIRALVNSIIENPKYNFKDNKDALFVAYTIVFCIAPLDLLVSRDKSINKKKFADSTFIRCTNILNEDNYSDYKITKELFSTAMSYVNAALPGYFQNTKH